MQTGFPNASQTQLKRWARLNDARMRQEEGIFLAEGIKVVKELLTSDWQIKAILVMPEKYNTGRNSHYQPPKIFQSINLRVPNGKKSDRTENRKASWRWLR